MGNVHMTAPVDLDALDALEREATAGEWRLSYSVDSDPYVAVYVRNVGRIGFSCSDSTTGANTRLVVALRNAYPALAAEIRSLRTRVGTERDDGYANGYATAIETAAQLCENEAETSLAAAHSGADSATLLGLSYQHSTERRLAKRIRALKDRKEGK